MTVAEVFEWYHANEMRKLDATADKERLRVRRLFAERLGHRPIAACRSADLIQFLVAQTDLDSNWTRRRWRATINAPCNAACQAGLIDRNPFRGVKIPEGKGGRDWTEAEFLGVLRNSKAYFRRLVVFCRFSGARPGEARMLKWDEIREDVNAVVQNEHKTDWISKSARRIYFNDVLLKLLCWLAANKQHDTYVFVNKFGRPWTCQSLTKHLRMVRKRVDLPDEVKLHGGRHTFATRALMNGVDLYTLASLLGHATVKTTEKYLHLLDKRDHLNQAMQRAIGRGTVPKD